MDQKVQKLLNEALIPRLAHNRWRQVTNPHRGLDLLHAKERTLAMTGTTGRSFHTGTRFTNNTSTGIGGIRRNHEQAQSK